MARATSAPAAAWPDRAARVRRYRAAYTGPDGQLYRAPATFFDAKDDAAAWLAARRAEIQMEVWALTPLLAALSGVGPAPPRLRGPAAREGRGGPRPRACPTTRQQHRMLLDTYIYPTFGDERLDCITAEDVTKWYDALASCARSSAPRPTACCARSSARPRQSGRSR
ncbi:MAG: hypothetical protein R2734_19740 [Nocardioides sp.]